MTERIILADGDRVRVAVDFTDHPSMTKQSMRDESNINNIMRKWRNTGAVDHLANGTPSYGDFTNADDYLSAVNAIEAAQADFAELPADVRARMKNSPAELLRFMANPSNQDEARDLGLAMPLPSSPEGVQPDSGGGKPTGDSPIQGGE